MARGWSRIIFSAGNLLRRSRALSYGFSPPPQPSTRSFSLIALGHVRGGPVGALCCNHPRRFFCASATESSAAAPPGNGGENSDPLASTASLPPSDMNTALGFLNLAKIHDRLGENPQKVLQYAECAMRTFGVAGGSIDTAVCLQLTGSALFSMRKYPRSLSSLDRAVAILEKAESIVGEWEIRRIKHSLILLRGRVKAALDMDGDALADYLESFAIMERLLEAGETDAYESQHSVVELCKALRLSRIESDAEAGERLFDLASLYQKSQKTDEAILALTRASEIFEKTNEESQVVGSAESQLGGLLFSKGLVEEATMHLERAVSIFQRLHGPESVKLLDLFNGIAIAKKHQGKIDDAVTILEKARQISENSEKSETSSAMTVYKNLVNVYSELSRFKDAVECQKCLIDAIRTQNKERLLKDAEEKLEQLLKSMESSSSSGEEPTHA